MSAPGDRLYIAYGTSAEEFEFRGLWTDLERAVREARATRLSLAYVAPVRIDVAPDPGRSCIYGGVMVGFRERIRDLLARLRGGSLGFGPMVALVPEDEQLAELRGD